MSSIARSTHWQPLCAHDPTPGDDEVVSSAGRKFQAVADEIEKQIAELGKIAEGSTSLQGDYVPTLQEVCRAVKDDLGKIKGRYREVGGLLKAWSPELLGFQQEAERLLDDAQQAQRGLDRLVVVTVPNDQMTDEQRADALRRQRQGDALRGELTAARRRLADLEDRRDRAAQRVANRIDEASQDQLTDDWWDNVKDWFAEHKDLIDGVCKVLGVVALVALVVCLVVPGLNIAAGAALVTAATYVSIGATSVSLLVHTGQAATGTGSWADVGLDAFSLVTFGVGKLLSVGAKEAAGAVRVEAATVAGERAAAPILEKAFAEVDELAKARDSLKWWKPWDWFKGPKLEQMMEQTLATGAADANAARIAAEEAKLAEKVTIGVGDVLRYGDGDLAKIAVQIGNDSRYLASMEASLETAAGGAEALVATGAGMFLASGGATVWSGVTSIYSPEWWDRFKENFVAEVGSLHLP